MNSFRIMRPRAQLFVLSMFFIVFPSYFDAKGVPFLTARVKIKVKGVVQGVGYRYYTYRIARGLDLKGYVRNQKDGSVEVLAEGEKDKLMELISELRIGPTNSRVDDLSVEWQDCSNEFSEFKILK